MFQFNFINARIFFWNLCLCVAACRYKLLILFCDPPECAFGIALLYIGHKIAENFSGPALIDKSKGF